MILNSCNYDTASNRLTTEIPFEIVGLIAGHCYVIPSVDNVRNRFKTVQHPLGINNPSILLFIPPFNGIPVNVRLGASAEQRG